jgi:hypothetical protein
MQQLTSSEHGEHARKLNELFRSVLGTPSRITAVTVLDGMRKWVVGTIREVIARTSRHKWHDGGKEGEGICNWQLKGFQRF